MTPRERALVEAAQEVVAALQTTWLKKRVGNALPLLAVRDKLRVALTRYGAGEK